jgi:hypothetical protein
VRVILHAGFHKTGTSTLQALLETHRAQLAPAWRVETRKGNPALKELSQTARAFSVAQDPVELALLRGLAGVWFRQLRLLPGQGLLISSEDFAGHMPGVQGVASYAAAAPIARVLAQAARAAFGAEVRLDLVYTTREPQSWLRSLYAQQARAEALVDPPEVFCRRLAPAADFAPVLRAVREALPFGEVHHLPLEDGEAAGLGPAGAVFDLAGLPQGMTAGWDRLPRRNESLPEPLVTAFVALNRSGLPRAEVRARKAALLAEAGAT